MATIMCLPVEVITIILGCNDLSAQDIMNFKCMWEQFRPTATYDINWERIFSNRWPFAKKLYDKQSKDNEQKDSEENEQKDKKSLNFIEAGINCARQLQNCVSQTIYQHYYKPFSIYEYKLFDNYLKLDYILRLLPLDLRIELNSIIYKPENSIKYSFFIDEIKNLLTQSPRRTGCDLTERYYNIKTLLYMRFFSIREKFKRFKEQPYSEQLLERIATFLAQTIQLRKDVLVFYSCVKASLDSIVLGVVNCLREKHPDHSIFSTSAETFSYWKNNNIDDNHWNKAEGTQIIDTLNEYIFGKLNFRPSKSEVHKFEYICIDNVLENKYGNQIILLIIYHSVARRLGLRCDIIGLQSRSSTVPIYCIVWKPEYATNSLENVRCFNISSKKFPDCFVNKLSLFRTLYLRRDSRAVSTITTAQQVSDEMKKLLVYSTNQNNKPFGVNFLEYDSNLVINRYLYLSFQKTKQLNTRPENVKYSVGMIITHHDQSTDLPTCVGVIIGWHRHIDTHVTFSLSDPSPEQAYIDFNYNSMPLIHCSNLNFTIQQTNYLILTENNKMCYVGEDAITLTTPKWIDNTEIGRYFCKFEDTHYLPNKMLAGLYPQDAAITAQTTISKN